MVLLDLSPLLAQLGNSFNKIGFLIFLLGAGSNFKLDWFVEGVLKVVRNGGRTFFWGGYFSRFMNPSNIGSLGCFKFRNNNRLLLGI